MEVPIAELEKTEEEPSLGKRPGVRNEWIINTYINKFVLNI